MRIKGLHLVSRSWILVVGLAVAATCAPTRNRTFDDGNGGAGGGGGSGGSSASGGSASGGSASGGSGGDSTGGSGSGGDATGGSGGAGAGGNSSGGSNAGGSAGGAGGDSSGGSSAGGSAGGAGGDNSGGSSSGGNATGGSSAGSGGDNAGGSSSGGTGGSTSSCSSGSANPCSSIGKLSGSENVDGKNDDWCQMPSFTFDVSNAAKVINYNNVPQSQFEKVTAWVAWMSSGFAAYFDVTDSSVQTVNQADASQAVAKAYAGDSIEIMISSSNSVTGLTGSDSNTLHVIIPADGPAVSVKTSNSGGSSSGTHSELPGSQYKQTKTSSGYAIEVQLPWPGGNPGSGSQIRFDLALNSADSIFGNLDDMRDGQLLYYVGSVDGSSTCQSADGTVPFCDDRTWCATTLQ